MVIGRQVGTLSPLWIGIIGFAATEQGHPASCGGLLTGHCNLEQNSDPSRSKFGLHGEYAEHVLFDCCGLEQERTVFGPGSQTAIGGTVILGIIQLSVGLVSCLVSSTPFRLDIRGSVSDTHRSWPGPPLSMNVVYEEWAEILVLTI